MIESIFLIIKSLRIISNTPFPQIYQNNDFLSFISTTLNPLKPNPNKQAKYLDLDRKETPSFKILARLI